MISFQLFLKLLADANITKVLFLHIKITEIQICTFSVMQHKQVYIFTCKINKTLLTRYFMALFITLGLISRPSAKMLNLAQHADYAQHLSVYAVNERLIDWCLTPT